MAFFSPSSHSFVINAYLVPRSLRGRWRREHIHIHTEIDYVSSE